ncbi:MAG: DUF86 domain-containing protein [Bacteroidales bacterium]|nr:DUF86 domain-containing protein [Bacteroidales bacterium]
MKEKPRDIERLQHMLDAVNDILEFTANHSFDDFCANKMMKHAVYRNLTIIGEAANLLTKDFREMHNTISWPQIIGMRHVLVHGYYEVECSVVWDTIENDLPKLRDEIRKKI